MFISVRVHPNAKRNELIGLSDGVWQIRVSAPPVKGKANTQLIAWLSRVLGVGKSGVSIVKGHTSRSKVIAIDGLTDEEVTQRLSSSSSSSSK
ncbi:DUF167 domain-containing protein [Chloroflexota bacterium]